MVLASEFAGTLDPATGFANYSFREDRAHYTSDRVGEPLKPLTRHTLAMELPATDRTRLAADQIRTADGLVARITMASGEVVVVGWSQAFAAAYPLRLTAMEAVSGSFPGDYPTVKLTLECYE